jgi:WD40 repeat protein
MAIPLGNSTAVLHRDRPDRRVILGPQYDVRSTAVSPDGRYVATGSHWEDGLSKSARIWDAQSGRQVHELPLEGSTMSRFSPDGRWLMTRTGHVGNRLWEVGTWREVRRFEYAGFAFSPDSRLLAINDVFGVVRLIETASGREVARLTGPEPMWYQPECFTPDGARLIATCSGHQALYVWDLRLIRRQLKELGLDWDWPEFDPAAEGSRLAGPAPVVRVLGAELLGSGKSKSNDAMLQPFLKLRSMILEQRDP